MLGCACGLSTRWLSSSSAHLGTIISGHPGECRDPVVFAKTKKSGVPPHTPSGAAEHRRGNRVKLAPCLTVIERSEIASCARAGFPEKRRISWPESQIQARTSHRVPFSLGTFSWASKRKYLARWGETKRRLSRRKLTVSRSAGLHEFISSRDI
jgi:hypothetical protein